MIEELATYISNIKDQFGINEFIEGPEHGLHIMLEVKNENVDLFNRELYKPSKGKEGNYSDFLRSECMTREMHIDFIDTWKAIRGKRGCRIRSATPFALKFHKKLFDEEWKKWLSKNFSEEIQKKIKKVDSLEKKLDSITPPSYLKIN